MLFEKDLRILILIYDSICYTNSSIYGVARGRKSFRGKNIIKLTFYEEFKFRFPH